MDEIAARLDEMTAARIEKARRSRQGRAAFQAWHGPRREYGIGQRHKEKEARMGNTPLDVATLVARLMQIDAEDRPTHWLWTRVMTCDVPRMRLVPEVASMLDQDFIDTKEIDGS
jgi:hypothetical protein